eukprot:gene15273-15424_t
MEKLDADILPRLFTQARTHSRFLPVPIEDAVLHDLYELVKFAPTSANCSPMRIVFVKSAEAKARLKPYLSAGNMDKTMEAAATAIIGYDMDFASRLPKLFPHVDARPWFAGTEEAVRTVALRNSSIQAGFLIVAARSLGLDTGPMSGFDEAGVNREFFAGTAIRANFLVNLGHGDSAKLHPRLPRLSFEDACQLL